MEALLGIIAGALLSQLGQWIEHRRQRQMKADERALLLADKANERSSATSDAHHAELRRSYAALITAHARYFDTGTQLLLTLRRVEQSQRGVDLLRMQSVYGDKQLEEYQKALASLAQWNERVRLETSTFIAASTEAQTKLVDVVLLENDSEQQSILGTLGNIDLKLPQSPVDYAHFEREIEKCRGYISNFKWNLAGRFAPRSQLAPTPGNTTKQIPIKAPVQQIAATTTPELDAGSTSDEQPALVPMPDNPQ